MFILYSCIYPGSPAPPPPPLYNCISRGFTPTHPPLYKCIYPENPPPQPPVHLHVPEPPSAPPPPPPHTHTHTHALPPCATADTLETTPPPPLYNCKYPGTPHHHPLLPGSVFSCGTTDTIPKSPVCFQGFGTRTTSATKDVLEHDLLGASPSRGRGDRWAAGGPSWPRCQCWTPLAGGLLDSRGREDFNARPALQASPCQLSVLVADRETVGSGLEWSLVERLLAMGLEWSLL